MKTLLALSALLLSSNAFAFSADSLANALNDPTVKETLGRDQIVSISHQMTYRCSGCYGIDVLLKDGTTYRLLTKKFGGEFSVSILKIEE